MKLEIEGIRIDCDASEISELAHDIYALMNPPTYMDVSDGESEFNRPVREEIHNDV